jgi:hypothetical protein
MTLKAPMNRHYKNRNMNRDTQQYRRDSEQLIRGFNDE